MLTIVLKKHGGSYAMKKRSALLLLLSLALFLAACGEKPSAAKTEEPLPAASETVENQTAPPASQEEETVMKLKITVNGQSFFAGLNDSPAAQEFFEMLPLNAAMTELNGNEKYYTLPQRLSADDRKIGTIETGDLMLYGGNCLVLFYDNFSTGYHYTPLGRISDPTGLKEAVGRGNVSVSFEIAK